MMHKLIGNEQSLVTDPGTSASASASASASEQNARPENGPRSAWSSLALHDKGTELFAAHATGSLVTPPAGDYKAAVISRDESIAFPLSPVHPAQARHFASHLSPPSFSGIDAIQDQVRQGKVIKYLRCQLVSWIGKTIRAILPDKIFWIPTKPSSLEEALPRHPESRLAQLFGGTANRFQMLEDVTTHACRSTWQFSDALSKKMCAHCGINPQPATAKCTGCGEAICSMCNNFRCTRIP